MLAFFYKYKQTILYLLFGFLTTLVNYLIYFFLYNLWHISAAFSNAIAWFFAVLFSFVVNKCFVFSNGCWSRDIFFCEAVKFFVCRFGSGSIETAVLFVTADYLHWNGNLWKIIVAVIVILLNYITSKRFVFFRR